MNLFRPLVIALCCALPWLPAGAVQAAEPAAKAQGVHKSAAKAAAKPAVKPKAKPKTRPKVKAKPVSKAVAKPLHKPKIDLSLPSEMVRHLEPDLGAGRWCASLCCRRCSPPSRNPKAARSSSTAD